MTRYTTTRFGEIEVRDDMVVELAEGLLGFPEYKRYALLDFDPDSPFKWLQSLDEGAVAFTIVDPMLFCPSYAAEMTEEEASRLGIEGEADSNAVTVVILTMPSNPQNMTANLRAPLVFNLKTRQGKQVLQRNPAYTTRHNIMEMMRAQMSRKE